MAETLLATFATTAGAEAAAAATTSLPWLVSGAQAGSFALTGSGALASAVSFLPSISSTFSVLSGLGTLAGAAGQVSAGNQAAATYKLQAQQEVLNSRLEAVKAEDQANQLRRNLMSNLASANAIFASRGIGQGGTPEQAKAEASRNASINIEKARFGGDMASGERIVQAGVYRNDARAAKSAGIGNALTTITSSKSLRSMLDL